MIKRLKKKQQSMLRTFFLRRFTSINLQFVGFYEHCLFMFLFHCSNDSDSFLLNLRGPLLS